MDTPEFADAVRNAPKGMFKEDEKGIHVGFEDLFRKEARQAGPSELMGMMWDLGKSDEPLAQAVFWGVLIVVVIPCILGMLLVLVGAHRPKRNTVPAIGSWIPLGVTVWFNRDPLNAIISQTKKFSKGFCISMGFTELTIFAGVKGQKEVTSMPKDSLSYSHGFKTLFENTLVSSRLKSFQDHFLQAVLTKTSFTDQISEFLPEIVRTRLEAVKDDETIDLFSLSSDISLRLLTRLAIGSKLLDENDDDIIPLMQATERTLMSSSSLFFRSLSFSANIPKTLFNDLSVIVQEELDLRKDNSEGEEGEKDDSIPLDIISILTKATPNLSVQGIVSHINMFVFSNHSDLACTIAWTIYHLIKDQSLQKRVMTEFSQSTTLKLSEKDFKSSPADTAVSSQPLLTSVIKEVGRLYAPLFLLTGSTKKQPLGKYDVYFCDLIATSPASISMNEKIYENPYEFDPSRFLDAKKIEVMTLQHKLLQFNNARNAWFDPIIAESIIKTTIVPMILEMYDFTLIDEKLIPRAAYLSSYGTPFSDLPVLVSVKPRKVVPTHTPSSGTPVKLREKSK
ncbi:hypothetical protein BASA50_004306 [Batrachochytrium salamandrivorans]|uniref:Cytochrome P450 n=1 Tax=Batrachochytrium salamandrivorans TaxID=1357716 RepID=A0ABQ8FG20_9FUNG|nr:hypothetical protein BASA50_004306 [Batrachochytrium salamandrivorans]KAH9264532.1 hypothetical protein BASA83_012003 [Batrachochytrium salamandrivorans]